MNDKPVICLLGRKLKVLREY